MHLLPKKMRTSAANAFLVYLESHETYPVAGGCKCRFPRWGAKCSPNPPAGFVGPLGGGGNREEKGKDGGEKRKETEGRKNTPPTNTFLVTALVHCGDFA